MGLDQATELAPGSPLSLAGALNRAVENMAGDEGKDDGILPHGGILAVLGKQVD